MSSKTTPRAASAGSGGKDGPAAAGANDDTCDLLINVDLEGVRLPPLAGLKIGDMLDVELRSEGPYPTVVCVDGAGQVVGALSAFMNLVQLIRCLRGGVRYRVGVTELRSGGCHVAGGRAVR